MLIKLIALTVLAYAILIGFIIYTQTPFLIMAILATVPMSLDLVFHWRYHKNEKFLENNKTRYTGKSFPFILFYLLPVIPMMSLALYLGYNFMDIGIIYSFIIAFGIMIIFIFGLFNLPLAIVHKVQEKNYTNPILFSALTVIVPAYNEQSGIGRTIEALIEADYPNKEIIIVDDGSVDQTYNLASSYIKKAPVGRFIIIRKENGGKGSALNYGLLFAKGEIVVVIDADAIIQRNTLKNLVKQFQDPSVVAISGNPQILNRGNFWGWNQTLEYSIGTGMFKRAFALFGMVMVVPGGLGAFRRTAMIQNGSYDIDTLTEDFDITIKLLKTGKRVVLSSTALSYSEAPETFKDLYNQRMRWQSGIIQTLKKHKDIMTNSNYGMLYKYGYPLILLTLVTLPFLGMIVTAFLIITVLKGMWNFFFVSLLVFTSLQIVLGISASLLDERGKWRSLLYAPLLIIGYKQILDFFAVKSVFDALLHKKTRWKSSTRYGMVASGILRKK